MKKNKTTIAEEHKKIYNRFYTNTKRKPGEDQFTDEAYNMAAKRLMEYQESIKPKESKQPESQNNSQFANQEFRIGGELPMHWDGSFLNKFQNNGGIYGSPMKYKDSIIGYNPSINTDYSNFGTDVFKQEGFQANITPEVNLVNPSANSTMQNQSDGEQYSPIANILGPALSIGANAMSSSILKNNAERRKKDLLKNVGVNLGRVQANQIDLGRERSNIRSNEALTESTGRYMAKGARSASEAARIALMAKLGGSRTAGDQLGQSYQKEEMVNADYRTRADETNRQLSAQEAMMKQQQTMDIEQRYGDAHAQIRAGFAQSTGQTIQNYMSENQRMKRDNNYLNMLNPNYELDYQQEYNKSNDMDQLLYRLGIKTLNPTKRVR